MIEKDKPYSVVIYTDNPALQGVMSRAWAGEEGVVDAFMSAALAKVDLPLADRVLASKLKVRYIAAQRNFVYGK
jgi:hypothetical protein